MKDPSSQMDMADPGEDGPNREKVGEWLRKARESAGIDAQKLCGDLKISPLVLESIENGDYRDLPGDPYVRALLGSIARYLNLNPRDVISHYSRDTGTVQAPEPTVAPYRDSSPTHRTAHRQVFIVVVIALMIILFFLIGRLNEAEFDQGLPDTAPAQENPTPEDDGLNAPEPESAALVPDSVDAADSAEPAAVSDSLSTKKVEEAAPPAANTVISLNALTDSVWVTVRRSGKPEFSSLLKPGRNLRISHTDTIFVVSGIQNALEVETGGVKTVPDHKRFSIYLGNVRAY